MLAVTFAAEACPGHRQDYLAVAAEPHALLDGQPGFSDSRHAHPLDQEQAHEHA